MITINADSTWYCNLFTLPTVYPAKKDTSSIKHTVFRLTIAGASLRPFIYSNVHNSISHSWQICHQNSDPLAVSLLFSYISQITTMTLKYIVS